MNFFDYIGYNGPIISIMITVVSLLDQKKYLVGFAVFYYVEYVVVGFLKQVIKQPRPNGYLDKQYDDTGDYTGIARYGWPSGHSSAVFYSTVFLWLVKKSPYLLIVELAICTLTLYQRWLFRKHSIEQLAAGAFVGGAIAFIAHATIKEGNRRFPSNPSL